MMPKNRNWIFLGLIAGIFFSCNNIANQKGNVNVILLSDSLATKSAICLYNNMYDIAKTHVMVGHQDDLAYGIGWSGDEFRSDINDACGDFPAIFGWDLGHITDSSNIDNVPFSAIKTWALKAYRKGGINTFGWHARNIKTGESSWDTTACVNDILPGGYLNDMYVERLNLIADFFTDLKDANGELIPVLFRPFHEMNGAWFWWGTKSCSASEYISLWQYTVNYLRSERNLHNLILIYSTDVFETPNDYLAYYPGDKYVDILGYDDYKGLRDTSTIGKAVQMIEILANLATEKNKLYTISETGSETISDSTWFTKVALSTIKQNPKTLGISYVLFWRNGRPDHFYAPYPGHPSVPDFMEFKNDSVTVFLNDLPNLYTCR